MPKLFWGLKKPLINRVTSKTIEDPCEEAVEALLKHVDEIVAEKSLYHWLLSKLQSRPLVSNPIVAFKAVWLIHHLSRRPTTVSCTTSSLQPLLQELSEKWAERLASSAIIGGDSVDAWRLRHGSFTKASRVPSALLLDKLTPLLPIFVISLEQLMANRASLYFAVQQRGLYELLVEAPFLLQTVSLLLNDLRRSITERAKLLRRTTDWNDTTTEGTSVSSKQSEPVNGAMRVARLMERLNQQLDEYKPVILDFASCLRQGLFTLAPQLGSHFSRFNSEELQSGRDVFQSSFALAMNTLGIKQAQAPFATTTLGENFTLDLSTASLAHTTRKKSLSSNVSTPTSPALTLPTATVPESGSSRTGRMTSFGSTALPTRTASLWTSNHSSGTEDKKPFRFVSGGSLPKQEISENSSRGNIVEHNSSLQSQRSLARSGSSSVCSTVRRGRTVGTRECSTPSSSVMPQQAVMEYTSNEVENLRPPSHSVPGSFHNRSSSLNWRAIAAEQSQPTQMPPSNPGALLYRPRAKSYCHVYSVDGSYSSTKLRGATDESPYWSVISDTTTNDTEGPHFGWRASDVWRHNKKKADEWGSVTPGASGSGGGFCGLGQLIEDFRKGFDQTPQTKGVAKAYHRRKRRTTDQCIKNYCRKPSDYDRSVSASSSPLPFEEVTPKKIPTRPPPWASHEYKLPTLPQNAFIPLPVFEPPAALPLRPTAVLRHSPPTNPQASAVVVRQAPAPSRTYRAVVPENWNRCGQQSRGRSFNEESSLFLKNAVSKEKRFVCQNQYQTLPTHGRQFDSDVVKRLRPMDKPTQKMTAFPPTVNSRPPLDSQSTLSGVAPQHEIQKADLVIGEPIGKGSSSIVYKGRWQQSDVAIKVMATGKHSQFHKSFMAELAVVMRLRHPNLVLFMGAVTQENSSLCLVTELCKGGSLFDALHGTKCNRGDDVTLIPPSRTLTWRQRLSIALDVAKAGSYLHHARSPILHRDIKSPNILLASPITSATDAPIAKLSDFGTSRFRDQGSSNLGRVGTFQWMAPEVILNKSYTEKADIYSFGIVLYELASLKVPYFERRQLQSPRETALEVALRGLRPNLSFIEPECPFLLRALIVQCWSIDPEMRPTFPTIVSTLEEVLNQLF